MSKLYKFKKWYDIDETAKRLSQTLGEEVLFGDVIFLVMEQVIPVYVEFRQKPFIEVSLIGRKLGNFFDDLPSKFKNKLNEKIKTETRDSLLAKEEIEVYSWEQKDPKNLYVSFKNGYCKLADHTILEMKYFFDSIRNKEKEIDRHGVYYIDNFIIEDNESYWRGLSRSYLPEENRNRPKDIDEMIMYEVGHIENYIKSFPVPDISDFYILGDDLYKLESDLNGSKTSKIEEFLGTRERDTYQNIIGALLGLLLGKSPNGKPYSQFNNQQSIIDAIHANYGETNGLSKRNLESKLAEAKRTLKSNFPDSE